MKKQVLMQLLKEFWIPGLLATGWTVYVSWEETISIQSLLGNFGPSFFLASWLTGQVFRVRKQAGVEGSLTNVQKRMESVIERLEHTANNLQSHITGGGSYCYYEILPQYLEGDDQFELVIKKEGSFTLYNVSAWVRDFRGAGENRVIETVVLGDIGGQIMPGYRIFHFDFDTARSFTVTFEARNGWFSQDIRFRLVDEKWQFASRVSVKKNVVREQVSDDFPRLPDGNPDWSECYGKKFD